MKAKEIHEREVILNGTPLYSPLTSPPFHKIAHCSRILRINYDMILAKKYCTQLWNWHWSKINQKYSDVRLMSINTSSSVNVNKSQKEHRPRFILAINLKFTCHGEILSNMVEVILTCEKIRLDPLVLQLVLR